MVLMLCMRLTMESKVAEEEKQEGEKHMGKNRRHKKCVLYLEKVKKGRERVNRIKNK